MISSSSIIKTSRLHLRPFTDADLPSVFEGLSHPRVIKYYGVSYDSLEATKEQMEWFQNLEVDKTGKWWAVCSENNAVFYGAGGINNWSEEHQKAEIGFWLLPEYWGNGFMKEAMDAIVAHCFDELNIHRIEGFVESSNSNCKRGLAKLGFQHEGTMMDCEKKNGAFISLDVFAKLR
jgi:[ribosomal protein S5]-alanine N-acetyltransferase